MQCPALIIIWYAELKCIFVISRSMEMGKSLTGVKLSWFATIIIGTLLKFLFLYFSMWWCHKVRLLFFFVAFQCMYSSVMLDIVFFPFSIIIVHWLKSILYIFSHCIVPYLFSDIYSYNNSLIIDGNTLGNLSHYLLIYSSIWSFCLFLVYSILL